MSNKSDRTEESFHRVHAVAIPLLVLSGYEANGTQAAWRSRYIVPFRLGLPDFRARAALSVFFLPDAGRSDDPADATANGDYFASGSQGLSVLGMESAEQQGDQLSPVSKVYGSPLSPIPLAGELFGWQVAAEADGKEWRCVLDAGNPVPGHGSDGWTNQLQGRWLAKATFTASDPMTDEEWTRVLRRIYLRGPSQAPVLPGGWAG